MRFGVTTRELVAGLSTATRALSPRSTLPVLEGVLIEASDEGLTLTCSDGSVSIVTSVAAEIEEEGSVVLPGRLFLEVMRKMPEGHLTASMNDNLAVTLRCMGSRTTISGQSAEHFPPLPTVDAVNTLRLPQSVLKDMINETSFAISADETRMILTGCLFEVNRGEARMVALDGFRLAMRVIRIGETAPDMSAIIPGRTLSEMVKTLDGGEEDFADLSFGKNQMVMELNGTRFYSILIEGEYIKYRQILPAACETRVRVNREQMARCVERASLMAREGKNNLIRMKMDDKMMIITSNSENGDVYEELPIDMEGEDLTIAFNVKYVSDVMRALTEDEICLKFTTKVNPCVIGPVEGDGFLYLVLPVRI